MLRREEGKVYLEPFCYLFSCKPHTLVIEHIPISKFMILVVEYT